MENSCLITIRSLFPSMHEAEKKIAAIILEQPEVVVNMTVAQVSAKTGVAESSIVRFCQKLSFSGFAQLKINLAKNLKKPEELILEDINRNDDSYTVTSKVFSSSIQALGDSIKMLDKIELQRAIDTLLKAKRIEFYGVGTSASIAMDAYYRFMRIGLNAYAATDPHISKVSANMLNSESVAVGISYTGRTKDTVRALEIAKNKGALTICITSYLESPIAQLADIKLVCSTAETKFMKEAISSRIVQIALLDSLYTCVALKKYDMVIENIENLTEILSEMRF
jgi:RpiR family transcriptional regulator, carbohydrate utilization regulator